MLPIPGRRAMGPNTADNLTGVFFFAFALFAMTTASILSGAVMERIKIGAYIILSIILGSVYLGGRCILGLALQRLVFDFLWLSRLWLFGYSSRYFRLFRLGSVN